MPDHAELLDRDELDALHRRTGTNGANPAVPVADDPAAGIRPIQSNGPAPGSRPVALPRAMGPAAFMAMQRLAGNRAMLQALARTQLSLLRSTAEPNLEEEQAAGATSRTEPLALPGLAGAAAGAPSGGGAAGSEAGAGAGAAAGAAGAAAGSALAEKAGAAAGAGGPAGAAGAAGAAAGSALAEKAGETAGAAGAAGAGPPGGGAAGSSHARKSPPPPITGTGGAAAGAGKGPATGGTAGGAGAIPATGGPGPATVAPTGAVTANPTAPSLAPAGGGNGPAAALDPNTAKSGIDWNQMLSDFGPPARTVLEIGRLVPGWGLLAGLASDSLSFASDLSSIPTSKNARFATDLVIFRNIVNILNNGLGHVLYVNQLIQDGLAGSVVGVEFTPLTAAANEVLSGVKVALDEVQLGTDIIVEVEALYQANHAPDSAEAEAWRALADGYAANILGDIVNTVLDLISLSSAGAANTAPVQQARLPLTLAGAFLEHAAPNIIGAINNLVGVWLGSGVTAGRRAVTGTPAAGGTGTPAAARPSTGPAASPGAGPGGSVPAAGGPGPGAGPNVQRIPGALPDGSNGSGGRAASLQAEAAIIDIAGGFIDVEAPQARATYDGINVVIAAFEAYAEDQIAQIDAVVGALTGGKSAFQVIRDAVKTGLDDMNRKLAMAQSLGETATNAKANAASISAACTAVLGGIDGLVMPSVRIPSVNLGDGVLADAASAIANTAAEAANAALELAISGVSSALDTAKDAIRSPILDLQSHADRLGEWLAILATKCTEMVATLHARIASFSEGLGHCNGIEDVINLIMGQVSDMTGMPRITVQDLRNTWNSVGPYIDQFAALGPQLHERATALRAQASALDEGGDGSPTFALPPGPPSNPGAGAGPGVGPPA